MAHPNPEALQAIRQLLRAAHFAAEKHASQKRKGENAEPYLNHVIEVAQLASMALEEPDADLVTAALLHDTIEDTPTTHAELVEHFGVGVASLVAELTDDKSLPKHERKRLQVEHAPHMTPRAQTIKLADKISNLRSILNSPPAGWSLERKKEYFAWARQVVNGIASPNPSLKSEFDRIQREFESTHD